VDDRDKDLTHLFVRDLDEIPVPPRSAWRRAAGRENTMRTARLPVAGAVLAVLAVGIIVGLQLNERRQTAAGPSSSPYPSPSATTERAIAVPCAPGACPTRSSAYNDDFGFLVTDSGTGLNIRKESSSVTPWVGSFQQQGFAVSPDGTRIAYWMPASQGAQHQLKVVMAANPNSLLFSSTSSANERGGGIAWSNDSNGLAYAVHTGDPATGSVIRTIVLGAAGPAQVVLTWNDPGRLLQPIAWDRTTNVLAAGVTGDGGFMTNYVTARTDSPTSQKQFGVTGRVSIGSVKASTDARFVLGVDIDTGFSLWPLDGFGARSAPPSSIYGKAGAIWRPGTHDVGFIGPSNQLWLYTVDLGGSGAALAGGAAVLTDLPAGVSLRLFRADGNAVLLAVPGGAGAGTRYMFVVLGKDNSPGDTAIFTDVAGLIGSVRLR